MYRFLLGNEAGTPAGFSAPFSGGVISLSKPKQLFVVSPSHIVVPAMAPKTAISNMITFITPAPISFLISSLVRASVATFVINSQGLIQVSAVNTPRFDHDPVTLAPKGLLIEVEETNLIPRSNAFSA